MGRLGGWGIRGGSKGGRGVGGSNTLNPVFLPFGSVGLLITIGV